MRLKMNSRLVSHLLYGLDLIWWGLVGVFFYRNFAFKVVSGLSLTQSNWLFWSLWVVCILMGLLLAPRGHRNGINLFATVNMPLGIYLIITYFQLYKTSFSVALCVIAIVLVLYICLVVHTNLPALRQSRFQRNRSNAILSFIHRGRLIVGMGMAITFLVFFVNLFFGAPLMEPTTEATDPKQSTQKISGNWDTILLLQQDQWEQLSVPERLNVLQTVANIEATYLGLPHELNVMVNNLNEITLGHYDDTTYTISLNPDHLAEDPAAMLVKTVAHEAFHAYEKRLVDLYNNTSQQEKSLFLFDRIKEYQENFNNYIDGNEDLEGYRTQAVEMDSVSYSIEAVGDYYDAINRHLHPEYYDE